MITKILNQIFKELYNLIFGIPSIKFKFQKYSYPKNKTILINRNKFFYDNENTPILLDNLYSDLKFLKKYLKKNPEILDIGANIGQFAILAKYIFPNASINSYEPNKKIFQLLKKNTQNYKKIQIFNFAVGDANEEKQLYYVNNKSAQGSIYKNNCSYNLSNKEILKEKILIKKINLLKNYDLVKIDTEGYELKIIKSIKYFNFKYIYIENSENIYPFLKNNFFLKKISEEFKKVSKSIKIIKIFKRKYDIYDNFLMVKKN